MHYSCKRHMMPPDEYDTVNMVETNPIIAGITALMVDHLRSKFYYRWLLRFKITKHHAFHTCVEVQIPLTSYTLIINVFEDRITMIHSQGAYSRFLWLCEFNLNNPGFDPVNIPNWAMSKLGLWLYGMLPWAKPLQYDCAIEEWDYGSD